MKKQCNFCGRTEREVPLLITGLHGCICSDCVTQAYQVLQANGFDKDAKKNKPFRNSRKFLNPKR